MARTTVTAYDYQELRAKAVDTRSDEDIAALGEWMAAYGQTYWNGEEYDIDNGLRLRPVYDWESAGEDDPPEQTGWELTY